MENQFFLDAGIPPLHFGQSLSSPMSAWQSLSSAMEIQATELNSDYGLQFDSALSSMVSSPAPSNSNISNESFMIRELIGKLGSSGNSAEVSPHSQPLLASYVNGNNSTNTCCYSTPLNSPPKLNFPMADSLVKEKLPSLGKSMGLSTSVAEFSADTGFAERAAKFSCFGSRSFNGRTSQIGLNNNNNNDTSAYRSNLLTANAKLPCVSSSPSLRAMASQVGAVQGTNKNSPLQDRSELTNSQEESTVSEQNPNGDPGFKASKNSNSRKRKAVPNAKTNETSASPSANAAKASEPNEESNVKRCKSTESNGKENSIVKAEEEAKESNGNAGDEKQKKTNNTNNTKPPEPPKDYVHVRARRGQATDSHSLAERVRREKINEKMKLLQNLVPGCNKLTGKAPMLDEIINYVQSLQRQVEFLSMKLASLNTRLDFNVDSLMSKDIFQSKNTLPHPIFPVDSSASAFSGQQLQQNPALHSRISNGTTTQCSVEPLGSGIFPNLNSHLPPINQFTETVPQYPTFCEDDLQT